MKIQRFDNYTVNENDTFNKIKGDPKKLLEFYKEEITDIIYDTLLGNTDYPQLKLDNIIENEVEKNKGTITLKYKLDEIFDIYNAEKKLEIDPIEFDITININSNSEQLSKQIAKNKFKL
jgi:hypothetical protein